MKNYSIFLTLLALILSGCIGDDIIEDFVEPTLRITTSADSIELNTTFQFEYAYLNNIGVQEQVDVTWTSSDNEVIEITNSGLATAVGTGDADITVEYIDE